MHVVTYNTYIQVSRLEIILERNPVYPTNKLSVVSRIIFDFTDFSNWLRLILWAFGSWLKTPFILY